MFNNHDGNSPDEDELQIRLAFIATRSDETTSGMIAKDLELHHDPEYRRLKTPHEFGNNRISTGLEKPLKRSRSSDIDPFPLQRSGNEPTIARMQLMVAGEESQIRIFHILLLVISTVIIPLIFQWKRTPRLCRASTRELGIFDRIAPLNDQRSVKDGQ